MKIIKKDQETKQEINTEIYLKKTKIKRGNRKKKKNHNMSGEKRQKPKEHQKNYRGAKKTLFFMDLILHAM